MANHYELLVSASDAEMLALVVGDRRNSHALEAEAANALTDLLMEARMVPHAQLPSDRVAMNSRVTYEQEKGARRTVTLVHPKEADAAAGRISVLSPVGRALLGRCPGSVAVAAMPGGRAPKLRILSAERLS
jgi:regulator of nucleoside diphosphate kinase